MRPTAGLSPVADGGPHSTAAAPATRCPSSSRAPSVEGDLVVPTRRGAPEDWAAVRHRHHGACGMIPSRPQDSPPSPAGRTPQNIPVGGGRGAPSRRTRYPVRPRRDPCSHRGAPGHGEDRSTMGGSLARTCRHWSCTPGSALASRREGGAVTRSLQQSAARQCSHSLLPACSQAPHGQEGRPGAGVAAILAAKIVAGVCAAAVPFPRRRAARLRQHALACHVLVARPRREP